MKNNYIFKAENNYILSSKKTEKWYLFTFFHISYVQHNRKSWFSYLHFTLFLSNTSCVL